MIKRRLRLFERRNWGTPPPTQRKNIKAFLTVSIEGPNLQKN